MSTVSVTIATVEKSLPVGSSAFDHYDYYLQKQGGAFLQHVATTDTSVTFPDDVADGTGYYVEVQSTNADGVQLDTNSSSVFDLGSDASPGTFLAANIVNVTIS